MSEIAIYREAAIKIKNAILQSRYRAASNANAEQLGLYYNIGRYVSENSRNGKWGTGAIEAISDQLQSEMPGLRGFSPTNMKNMRIFYDEWNQTLETNRQLPTVDLQTPGANRQSATAELDFDPISLTIHHLPSDELEPDDKAAFLRIGFTHHREIIAKCKSPDERWYYIRKCASEFWSVEALKSHLKAGDYKRFGALPNNFSLTLPDTESAARAVRSFKDEYLLDFIDIRDAGDYDERDVENAIVNDIRKFIMACGVGFCFIGNQYRLIVSEEEFFVDLLFFERNLQCLVAFELKRGRFFPADLGQLNFYLSALDEYVRKPYENKSIGILLCKGADETIVELAVRDFKSARKRPSCISSKPN
jgi:predicted nuclease of restriction endonuclease-like (RecB) superfamily